MHPYLLIPLLSCLAAAVIASAILARDPGQRANRLVAVILACSAYWSLCELVWNASDDAESVVRWIRLSCLGWMWVGPLILELYVEVRGDPRTPLRRLVPFAYATTALSIPFYVLTPWFVAETVRTSWGWGVRFGPLFPVVVLPTLLYVSAVLLRWPRLLSLRASPAERSQGRWLYAAIAGPLALSTTTDALLPWLDVQVPRLGSASLLAVGCVVAWSINRYGYFTLAPGAFAQEIVETLRDGVALLHADGRIRSCNAGLARLVGCPAEDLRGVPMQRLLPALSGRPEGELRHLETELRPRPELAIPVSVSASTLRDERGQRLGQVYAIRDERDVVSLRDRLVTSGRLAAVGELAAGIAHEINNPISYLRSNLVELRRQWATLAEESRKALPRERLDGVFEDGEELLEESIQGIERIAAIARDVGAFSRAGRGRSELVDLNALLENTANVAALRYSVTLERCYAELPPVRCTPHQMRQVFLSLMFNALRAVGESGHIRLVTQARGGSVTVRVEDDGCGMSPEVLERIFDPFFTTLPAGEGTGLGLALSYQIVRNHGGEIHVESQPGRGSRFSVRLPAARDAAGA